MPDPAPLASAHPDDGARAGAVAILGSCVSRDSAEELARRGWEVRLYVARQSLASTGHPVPDGTLDLGGLSSAFQRRVLAGDAAGDALDRLTDLDPAPDSVLLDIVDERLGFFVLPDGGVLTRTTEGIGEDLYAGLDGARLVEFGSDEHFERWREGLDALVTVLDERGLTPRTRVLLTPWAMVDDAGEPTPTSFGTTALEANFLSARYHEALREALPRAVLELPEELAVAGTGHVWGPAPFHYVDGAYAWVADRLEELRPGRAER